VLIASMRVHFIIRIFECSCFVYRRPVGETLGCARYTLVERVRALCCVYEYVWCVLSNFDTRHGFAQLLCLCACQDSRCRMLYLSSCCPAGSRALQLRCCDGHVAALCTTGMYRIVHSSSACDVVFVLYNRTSQQRVRRIGFL
jgi:hypothetical protein